ncbi:MAG: ABC-2 type transport system ATP-binding protein [Akkermansiaceae bacterium]|jgi:ABC-2 type transport system ATP-binding protein
MSDYALDLSGIRKTYRGGVEALKGIDLQVPQGCIYGLLGPNGAGKSTMIKILTTLIRRSGGEGTMLGKPIGDRETLQKVGLLPEHAQFPSYLTGRQVIEFAAGLQNVPTALTRQRTDELLEKVGMTNDQNRTIKSYSKGMKQRIGLAQALVNDPQIIFLDEPTDGVDPAGRRDFRAIVRGLRDEGRTLFINTHILSELEPIVDRVAIMTGGEILGEGKLDELRTEKTGYVVSFEGQLSPEGTAKFKEGGLESEAGSVKLSSANAVDAQPVIDRIRQEGLVITGVSVQSQSLEDLFIGLVGGESAPPPMPVAPVQPPSLFKA